MNFKTIFAVLLLTLNVKITKTLHGGGHWWYKSNSKDVYDPPHWSHISIFCKGMRQSPINIEPLMAKKIRKNQRVTIENVFKLPKSITYTNTGHGYVIAMEFEDPSRPFIRGGPLGNDSYSLINLHFHHKSEHTLNNVSFDAELHLVFFNSKYKTILNAFSHSDGLAVLGIFQEVKFETRNSEIKNILQKSHSSWMWNQKLWDRSSEPQKMFGNPEPSSSRSKIYFRCLMWSGRKAFQCGVIWARWQLQVSFIKVLMISELIQQPLIRLQWNCDMDGKSLGLKLLQLLKIR